MAEAEFCPACSRKCDGEILGPRILPCGSTLCVICLNLLTMTDSTWCLTCKNWHRAPNRSEIPIIRAVDLSLLPLMKVRLNAQSSLKIQQLHRMIFEQGAKTQYLQRQCESMKAQLHRYRLFLLEVSEKGNNSHELLFMTQRNQSMIKDIKKETRKITEAQRECAVYSKELAYNASYLRLITRTRKGTVQALTHVGESIGQLDNWLDKCRQQFPNFEFSPFISITRSKLHEDPWRQRIASGRVIAVDCCQGRQRSANLSLKDGKIYLHCLREMELNENRVDGSPLFRIKHDELPKCLITKEAVAFMDLAWEGSPKGRLHILLAPDLPLARQFKDLCTGVFGPSFAKTKFFASGHLARNLSFIKGGDYEHNNGTGGMSVYGGVDLDCPGYKHWHARGSVWAAAPHVHETGSQFSITVGSASLECQPSKCARVFGIVQDGSSLLIDAFQRLQTNGDVEIIDCGVVLPLENG